MSALSTLLDSFRDAAASECKFGRQFEHLVLWYLRTEASYRNLYSQIWTYADWAKQRDIAPCDINIDFVAKTENTDEFHAIQCKLCAETYCLPKAAFDEFVCVSGKKYFTRQVIVITSNYCSRQVEVALSNSQPPVTIIGLSDLENSQIDWTSFHPDNGPFFATENDQLTHQTATGYSHTTKIVGCPQHLEQRGKIRYVVARTFGSSAYNAFDLRRYQVPTSNRLRNLSKSSLIEDSDILTQVNPPDSLRKYNQAYTHFENNRDVEGTDLPFVHAGPDNLSSSESQIADGQIKFNNSILDRSEAFFATEKVDLSKSTLDSSSVLTEATKKEFHFLLEGDGARSKAIMAHSMANLVFRYDNPPVEALHIVCNDEFEANRVADVDIRLDLTAYGNLTLPEKRSDVARFSGGHLLAPLAFVVRAGNPSDQASGIHVSFVANGMTIHQVEIPITVLPHTIVTTEAPATPQGRVPLSLVEDAVGLPPPPPDQITVSLSLEEGVFVIDAMHHQNNELQWSSRAFEPTLDAVALASQLLSVLQALDGCYQSEGWIGYDGGNTATSGMVKAALEDAMSCAAEAGSKLNKLLRSHKKIVPILDYIEQMPDGSRITIATRDVFLPWELLYSGDWSPNFSDEQKAANPIDSTRFWGARFAIETSPQQGQRTSQMYAAHLASKPRRVSVNVNPTIAVTGQPPHMQPLQVHQAWADKLNRQTLLDGKVHDSCKAMRDVLQNGQHGASLIYVYCHGRANQPFGGQSELLDLDAGCRLDPSAVTAANSPLYTTAPIVFLNACNTGVHSPLAYSNFLKAFQERGAIGLVATTYSVPITFAAHFGPEVVEAYLKCKGSLASSLRILRHKYLTQGNPVPLFYSLQCQLTVPNSN